MSDLTANDVGTLEWFTVREVANRWRVSADTVLRMIERHEVVAKKFGFKWRIHTTAVESFERSARPRQAPATSARPAAVIDRGDPLGLYSGENPAPSTGRSR
jgi:excisionase family DNA binding protein